jgi:dihydrofolate reductase
LNAIVAVDRNWAIGNKGQLLVSIPNDHKMFRQETLEKVIIYGRKTLETFPLSRPLDRRVNIILSANPDYKVNGALVVHSIEELKEAIREYDTDDVYVIGGASVYRQFFPYLDTVHITKIDLCPESDSFFPDLDALPDWDGESGDWQEENGVRYCFCTYKKK